MSRFNYCFVQRPVVIKCCKMKSARRYHAVEFPETTLFFARALCFVYSLSRLINAEILIKCVTESANKIRIADFNQ